MNRFVCAVLVAVCAVVLLACCCGSASAQDPYVQFSFNNLYGAVANEGSAGSAVSATVYDTLSRANVPSWRPRGGHRNGGLLVFENQVVVLDSSTMLNLDPQASEFLISVWASPLFLNRVQSLFSRTSGLFRQIQLSFTSSNQVMGVVGGAQVIAGGPVALSEWHQYSLWNRRNAGGVFVASLAIDGVEVGTVISGEDVAPSAFVQLGLRSTFVPGDGSTAASFSDASAAFYGFLDDVFVYVDDPSVSHNSVWSMLASASTTPLSSTLALYFPMDETDGSTSLVNRGTLGSGSLNRGVFTSSMARSHGGAIQSSSLHAIGSGAGVIRVQNDPAADIVIGRDEYTINVWASIQRLGRASMIVARGGNNMQRQSMIRVSAANAVEFIAGQVFKTTASNVITDSAWHMYSLTVSQFQQTTKYNAVGYLDGVVVVSSFAVGSDFPGSAYNLLMQDNSPSAPQFATTGRVDEFRVYYTALSSIEIAALYASQVVQFNSSISVPQCRVTLDSDATATPDSSSWCSSSVRGSGARFGGVAPVGSGYGNLSANSPIPASVRVIPTPQMGLNSHLNEATVSFWLLIPGSTTHSAFEMVDATGRSVMSVRLSGATGIRFGCGDTSIGATFTRDTWHMVTVTRSRDYGSLCTAFVDAVQVTNFRFNANGTAASELCFGRCTSTNAANAAAIVYVDDIRVQSRAIPLYEILNMFLTRSAFSNSPTVSRSASVSGSRTPSRSPTQSRSNTRTVTASQSAVGSPSVTGSISESPSHSVSVTGSASPTSSSTSSISHSSTSSVTASSTLPPSISSSTSPSTTGTVSATITASSSATVTRTGTVSPTVSSTVTATASETMAPSASTSESATVTSSVTASRTLPPSHSETATSSVSSSSSASASATSSSSASASASGSSSASVSASRSASVSASSTSSASVSASVSSTTSVSATASTTATFSGTATDTTTGTTTVTGTSSASATSSGSITATITATTSGTITVSATHSESPSVTGSITSSPSASATRSSGFSGCTDSTALNFNPLSVLDDGSCIYADCSLSQPLNVIKDTSTGCEFEGFGCVGYPPTSIPGDPSTCGFSTQSTQSRSVGDPHVTTFQGTYYDNYECNDYLLLDCERTFSAGPTTGVSFPFRYALFSRQHPYVTPGRTANSAFTVHWWKLNAESSAYLERTTGTVRSPWPEYQADNSSFVKTVISVMAGSADEPRPRVFVDCVDVTASVPEITGETQRIVVEPLVSGIPVLVTFQTFANAYTLVFPNGQSISITPFSAGNRTFFNYAFSSTVHRNAEVYGGISGEHCVGSVGWIGNATKASFDRVWYSGSEGLYTWNATDFRVPIEQVDPFPMCVEAQNSVYEFPSACLPLHEDFVTPVPPGDECTDQSEIVVALAQSCCLTALGTELVGTESFLQCVRDVCLVGTCDPTTAHQDALSLDKLILSSGGFIATSCLNLLELRPSLIGQDGIYAIHPPIPPTSSTSGFIQVFCDMTTAGGGWTRVVRVDPLVQCPSGWFREAIDTGLYACRRPDVETDDDGYGQCSSTEFSTLGIGFGEVRGSAHAFTKGSPTAFSSNPALRDSSHSYTDGLGLLYGDSRTHLWTYAIGSADSAPSSGHCPCSTTPGSSSPTFVGSNYYCQSASTTAAGWDTLSVHFDSMSCDGSSTGCCSGGAPSEFHRVLTSVVNASVEARICTNELISSVNVGIYKLELFIRERVPDLDTDADGWIRSLDNCPAVYNILQENFDGDEFGDACDPCANSFSNLMDIDGLCICPEGQFDNGKGFCVDIPVTPSMTPSTTGSFSSSVSTTATFSPTPSFTNSNSPTVTETPTHSASVSVTNTASASATVSASVTSSVSSSFSETTSTSLSATRSVSLSLTSTKSNTQSVSVSPSNTVTGSITPTSSSTPTVSLSENSSPSNSATVSLSISISSSQTPSRTATGSVTGTPSVTVSHSGTPSTTFSRTASPSGTPIGTPSSSVTRSVSVSASVTPMMTPVGLYYQFGFDDFSDYVNYPSRTSDSIVLRSLYPGSPYNYHYGVGVVTNPASLRTGRLKWAIAACTPNGTATLGLGVQSGSGDTNNLSTELPIGTDVSWSVSGEVTVTNGKPYTYLYITGALNMEVRLQYFVLGLPTDVDIFMSQNQIWGTCAAPSPGSAPLSSTPSPSVTRSVTVNPVYKNQYFVFRPSDYLSYVNTPVAFGSTTVIRTTNPGSPSNYQIGAGVVQIPASLQTGTLKWAIQACTPNGTISLGLGVQSGSGDTNNLSKKLNIDGLNLWRFSSTVTVTVAKPLAYLYISGSLNQEIRIRYLVLGLPADVDLFMAARPPTGDCSGPITVTSFAPSVTPSVTASITPFVSPPTSYYAFEFADYVGYVNVPTLSSRNVVLRTRFPGSPSNYQIGAGAMYIPTNMQTGTLKWAVSACSPNGTITLGIGVQSGSGDTNNLSTLMSLDSSYGWRTSTTVSVTVAKPIAYLYLVGPLEQELRIQYFVLGTPRAVDVFMSSNLAGGSCTVAGGASVTPSTPQPSVSASASVTPNIVAKGSFYSFLYRDYYDYVNFPLYVSGLVVLRSSSPGNPYNYQYGTGAVAIPTAYQTGALKWAISACSPNGTVNLGIGVQSGSGDTNNLGTVLSIGGSFMGWTVSRAVTVTNAKPTGYLYILGNLNQEVRIQYLILGSPVDVDTFVSLNKATGACPVSGSSASSGGTIAPTPTPTPSITANVSPINLFKQFTISDYSSYINTPSYAAPLVYLNIVSAGSPYNYQFGAGAVSIPVAYQTGELKWGISACSPNGSTILGVGVQSGNGDTNNLSTRFLIEGAMQWQTSSTVTVTNGKPIGYLFIPTLTHQIRIQYFVLGSPAAVDIFISSHAASGSCLLPSTSNTVTALPTPSYTATLSSSRTFTPTSSFTATGTISSTLTASSSGTISESPTQTRSTSLSSTASITASTTASTTSSRTPSVSESTTSSVTASVSRSPTSSITPSVTPTSSISVSTSLSSTSSVTPSVSESRTSSITPSPSPSSSNTMSTSLSSTSTVTSSISFSSTSSITPSASPTSSISLSTSLSKTSTVTNSISLSSTSSITPSASPTSSISLSTSLSKTSTVTNSISLSPTSSLTPSISVSSSISRSPTMPPSASNSLPASLTPSVTSSISQSRTSSISVSRSVPASVSISLTSSATASSTPNNNYFQFISYGGYVNTPSQSGSLVILSTPSNGCTGCYQVGTGVVSIPTMYQSGTVQFAILACAPTGATTLGLGVQSGSGDTNNLATTVSIPALMAWRTTAVTTVNIAKPYCYLYIPGGLGQVIRVRYFLIGIPSAITSFIANNPASGTCPTS